MKNLLIFICGVFFCMSSNLVLSENKHNAKYYIQKSRDLQLSKDIIWQKLLHYELAADFNQQLQSAIQSSDFFLSENGRTSLSDELEETLYALFLVTNGTDEKHAQCKFPARLQWLKKKLSILDGDLPKLECQNFNDWTFGNSVQSISMVYASGFLGNPATFYGHTLLKLNSGIKTNKTKLMDQSINYGIISPPDANAVSYILKSLVGGYEGRLDATSYSVHTRNYAEHELRDLWEYELNLNQDETDFIAKHLWELIGKRYTYYFFRKNCAYRLAEILEIVEGVETLPSNPVYILPRAILQKMSRSFHHGKPLIRSKIYHPSRQSRLYTKFSALTSTEQKNVRHIVSSVNNFNSESYKSLALDSKKNVSNTLLDYYKFTEKSEFLPIDVSNKLYDKSLIERFKLGPKLKNISPLKEFLAPDQGRRSSQIRLGILHNNKLGDGASIHVRPAYYDVLDADSGHAKDSALAMGELKMVLIDNSIKIRQLDIVKIKSVNPNVTSLPGDNGKAWKFKLSLRQQNLECLDCLALRVESDYGYTTRPSKNFLIGVFAGAGIQDNRNNSGNIFAKASFFSHIRISNSTNMRLLAELPEQLDGSGGGENHFLLEMRQVLSKNIDMRFLLEKNYTNEISIALGYYF